MNTKWGLLLFLAFVVYQVVAAVLQAAAKKQQKQQQQQQQQMKQAARQGGVATGRQPATARPTAQTLADRRRAQLEELRARRQQRGGSGPVQVRTGPVSSPPSSPLPIAPPTSATRGPLPLKPGAVTSSRRTIRTLHVDPKKQREQEQAEKRRQEANRRRHLEMERQAALRSDRADDALAQKRELKQRQALRKAQLPGAEADPYQRKAKTSQLSRAVRRHFTDVRSLRELLVAKELLDPPLALRE